MPGYEKYLYETARNHYGVNFAFHNDGQLLQLLNYMRNIL